MTNRNDGSAQNTLKELHSTHSFMWRCGDKSSTIMTCNKAGTVEDSLKKSAQFRKLAEKNKNKELVIVSNGKAISSHSPCMLVKQDECLTVKFVKVVGKLPVSVSLASRPFCELVMFHVFVKGGKNVTNILRNPALRTKAIHEITVYAYKGEKVKQALKRDGRFLHTIFKKNIVLSHRDTEVKTELSNLVDHLHGKTFQITLLNRSSPPESLPGSLDDAYPVPSEAQSQSDSENGNMQKKEAISDNSAAGNALQEIPESKHMQGHLRSLFEDSVKAVKTYVPKLSRIQNLLRVEFGQNTQMSNEVKTMKQLMNHSNSVCQVRINGSPRGSGFLLFGRCVLTNGHVIKDIYNENLRQLYEKVSVHFSYESVEPTDEALDVEEVVCFEYYPEEPARDWALLRLSDNQTLPAGLLKHSGFLPEDGGICIIGHPYGGVKQIDPCLIVSPQNRNWVIERHCTENQGYVQLITRSFFEGVAQSLHQKKLLTYESCFYYGSSGSPVFDKHCHVIAVHSGGYLYKTAKGDIESVIEYAHPLSAIIERLIIQLVERKRVDVLKEYLACNYSLHQTIMANVKNLVESRNLTFGEAVDKLKEMDVNILKPFLKLFSLKEETVPMEIN